MKLLTHRMAAVVCAVAVVAVSACGSFKELNEDPSVPAARQESGSQETVVPEPPPVVENTPPPPPVRQAQPVSEDSAPEAQEPAAHARFEYSPDSSLVLYGIDADLRESRVSHYDILHTSLDLRFNFEDENLAGTATHTLRLSAPLPETIRFDGADMKIHAVNIMSGSETMKAKYRYDGTDVSVHIPKGIEDNELAVSIEYTGDPMRNGQKRGMYFVDGANADPSKPTAVWTLGQPEDNQFWYPTWDYPTDRMTFDLRLQVPENMTTVSNGTLVTSTTLGDGYREDHWTMDQPHLAYLTAIAAGEYVEVGDDYVREDGSSVPLSYFVFPEYADRADAIFGETPEMLAFLETRLGSRYPWSNYKQVAVPDFTAGGMENTTASILFSQVQHDERAAIDYSPRNLLMHELAHQWFGDYVTAKDWGNLALNEGLASFLEGVYLQEKFGEAERQIHAIEERSEYFAESQIFQRPVVWHGYADPNEMYDDHTYEKASQALSQLRYEIGGEAFFRGLRGFLSEYGGASASIRDLERSFSRATGRELAFFFDQWFFSAGHPVLSVSSGYRADLGIYQFKISQQQGDWGIRTFSFPVDVEIVFENRQPYRERIYVSSADTTISVGIAGKVMYGSFNRFNHLFAEIYESKKSAEWVRQAGNDDDMSGRYRALEALADFGADDEIKKVAIDRLLHDGHYFVRARAATTLSRYTSESDARNALIRKASIDPSSRVRRAAITALGNNPAPAVEGILIDALTDSSYAVIGEAVRILGREFPETAGTPISRVATMRTWANTVERAVVDAAVMLGNADGINILTTYLAADRPESLRAAAVEGIGTIGIQNASLSSQARSMLKNLKNDMHPAVRAAVAHALDSL